MPPYPYPINHWRALRIAARWCLRAYGLWTVYTWMHAVGESYNRYAGQRGTHRAYTPRRLRRTTTR